LKRKGPLGEQNLILPKVVTQKGNRRVPNPLPWNWGGEGKKYKWHRKVQKENGGGETKDSGNKTARRKKGWGGGKTLQGAVENWSS